jgi:hypothetical protein
VSLDKVKDAIEVEIWEELKKLVKPIHQVWERFKSEILLFLSLSNVADTDERGIQVLDREVKNKKSGD